MTSPLNLIKKPADRNSKEKRLIELMARKGYDKAKLFSPDFQAFTATTKGKNNESLGYVQEKLDSALSLILKNGFPDKPFLEFLRMPSNMRPSSFEDCVSLFFPLSGDKAREGNFQPFSTTLLSAYAEGRVPPNLGEVTMMYHWFLIYRLLLCPKTFSDIRVLETNAFSFRREDLSFQSESVKQYMQDVEESNINTFLKVGSSLTNLAKRAVESGAFDGDGDWSKLLEDEKIVSAMDDVYAFTASQITSSLGLSPGSSSLIQGALKYSVSEIMTKQEFDDLSFETPLNFLSDMSPNFKKVREYVEVFSKQKLLDRGLDMFDVNALLEFELTAFWDTSLKGSALQENLITKIGALKNSGISEKAKSYINEKMQSVFNVDVANFNVESAIQNIGFNVLGEYRKNPAVTTTLAVLSSAFQIGGKIYDYRVAEQKQLIKETTHSEVWSLRSDFIYKNFDFSLNSHDFDGPLLSSDLNALFARSCTLHQAGMLLDFFNFCWIHFAEPIREARSNRLFLQRFAQNDVASLKRVKNIDFNNYLNLSDFSCGTMRKFKKDIFISTYLAIRNLDKLTPLSFTFSFLPKVYMHRGLSDPLTVQWQRDKFKKWKNYEHPSVYFKAIDNTWPTDNEMKPYYAGEFGANMSGELFDWPVERQSDISLTEESVPSDSFVIDGGAYGLYMYTLPGKERIKWPHHSWSAYSDDELRKSDSFWSPHLANDPKSKVGGSFAKLEGSSLNEERIVKKSSAVHESFFPATGHLKKKSDFSFRFPTHPFQGTKLDVIYDRAFGTPIFRGQFLGLLAVIFSYPGEALKTLDENGVSWAKGYRDVLYRQNMSSNAANKRKRYVAEIVNQLKARSESFFRRGSRDSNIYDVDSLIGEAADATARMYDPEKVKTISLKSVAQASGGFAKEARKQVEWTTGKKIAVGSLATAVIGFGAFKAYKKYKG